jgi:hypothetical protein
MVNQDYNENEARTTNPVIEREGDSDPDNEIAERELVVRSASLSSATPKQQPKQPPQAAAP